MVLVKVDITFGDGYVHKTDGGLEIEFAGVKWNEHAHIPRFGTVVRVPNRLVLKDFSNMDLDNTIEWKTDIEIEEGDEVYFGKMASANAPLVVVGDDVYYLLNYGDLILRVRDGEIYPLNGYVLLESVIEETRIDGLILEFGDFVNKRLGVVTHVGTPTSSHFGSKLVDADVEVGDEVIFGGEYFGELEEEMFAKLEKGLGYCQRRWIIGKTN